MTRRKTPIPFWVEKTTGDFQKVFISFLEQEAELQEKINSIMDRFIAEHSITLEVGLILLIAIFGAFKDKVFYEVLFQNICMSWS